MIDEALYAALWTARGALLALVLIVAWRRRPPIPGEVVALGAGTMVVGLALLFLICSSIPENTRY
jgi:hypothetical protein